MEEDGDQNGDQLRGSVSMVLHTMRSSSDSAVEELWDRYFPRLVRVARSTLRSLPHRMHDADDAAQSAFVSFWRGLSQRNFLETLDRNSLWKLLTTITVRKARRIVRREYAQKRGGGRLRRLSELESSIQQGALQAALAELPSEQFDVACEESLESLPEELREFAVLRLFGHTNVEIAEIVSCSLRRVERKLARIREIWQVTEAEAEQS